MSIRPPAIHDRTFPDLVDELIARIPAHTPEWTNPRVGDPGRTILELFAWLTDTLLYRANLIPERQRLAFLSLLGIPLRAAVPARGVVALAVEGDNPPVVRLAPLAKLPKPVPFETLSDVSVLPVEGVFYAKRVLTEDEETAMQPLIDGLRDIYKIDARRKPKPYQTTAVFPTGAVPAGFDIVSNTIDRTLWLALLAPEKQDPAAIRRALGPNAEGQLPILSVGLAPSVQLARPFPESEDDLASRDAIPFAWEVARERQGKIEYIPLDLLSDTSNGLTTRGVMRLTMPDLANAALPANDVRQDLFAGVETRPPRLDEPDKAARLLAWLRIRPTIRLQSLSLTWAGVNCVEIDQRQTHSSIQIGSSNGLANQEFALPARSIDPASLQLQVEESTGFQLWRAVEDLAIARRDDAVFYLDAEEGSIRFGDGVRGRIPDVGARIRLAQARAGGGRAGNLPAGSLQKIEAVQLDGSPVTRKLKVTQAVATDGGEEAETIVEAERRIPALFRHQNRAVTEDDYRTLASLTPGVQMGRVDVLPLFLPHQRRLNVPGVVSVMVLPFQSRVEPPNPRPDRPFLEAVDNQLQPKRPIGAELYVIGCEYIPIGIAVGVTVRDGFARDPVALAVKEMLRLFLWPLSPGGPTGEGYPLNRRVRERELEAVVARVSGVDTVTGINVFVQAGDDWAILPQPASGAAELPMREWQLPELLAVVVATDGTVPADLSALPNPFAAKDDIAVPVVPEIC